MKNFLLIIIIAGAVTACTGAKIEGCWQREVVDADLSAQGVECLTLNSDHTFCIEADMHLCRPDSLCSLNYKVSIEGSYNRSATTLSLMPNISSYTFAADSDSFTTTLLDTTAVQFYRSLTEVLSNYYGEVYSEACNDSGILITGINIDADTMYTCQPEAIWVKMGC